MSHVPCMYVQKALTLLLMTAAVPTLCTPLREDSSTASTKGDDNVSVLVGAHYFGGWYYEPPANYSHFHGFTPTGTPTLNFFDAYPARTPLLGNLSTSLSTINAELRAADAALDFFDVLFYDGGEKCGWNADPNMANCLNIALAFMLNTTTGWTGVKRLHFFISYSNDVDRNNHGALVGAVGDAKWAGLTSTWIHAMQHPRYLKVNGRPVFKVLIPDIFISECGGNVTLAHARINQLRLAARAAGVGDPVVGGGWQNPYIPATNTPAPTPRPHPDGYMLYPGTDVACPSSGGPSCVLKTLTVTSLVDCEAHCNTTQGCTALTLPSGQSYGTCTLLSMDGPGHPNASVDIRVRVMETMTWEWTGTYNAAPPVCPGETNWVCPKYVNSWMPNATPTGAKVFPYMECGAWQGLVRTNHSVDTQPYLANLIAGFDPRPWEEHAASFAMPTETEWRQVLTQIKSQCLDPHNRFGFPDASKASGYQPAFNIYAWNEFGEGGIMAPTQGEGFMKLQTIAQVFNR
eukprot:m.45839 g.45839  ORF g.45839 m.45839 type:complete len:517 (-) comp6698_c0_seq2:81-1631(-)